MSVSLFHAVRAPHESGLKYGGDTSNPLHYQHIAYLHPDCTTTYFACEVGKLKFMAGFWHHDDLTSAVKAKKIPAKPDHNVWGIPAHEHQRLVKLEVLFWRDHQWHLDRHGDEEAAIAFAHKRVLEQARV